MDGRRWALCAAVAAMVGCNSLSKSTGPKLSQNSTPKPISHGSNDPTIKVAQKPGPPEPIKPSTLVAVGQYRDQLAAKPELSFADKEQLRSQARQAYQQAIQANPNHTPAYIALAQSYSDVDDHKQAATQLQKALAIMPKEAALWHEMGLTQARAKDWPGALESLERATQIDPDNRQYSRTLGLTMARAGNFDEALAWLAKSMREEEARYTVARMMQHVNQPEAAQEQLNLSLKANPAYMPAREMIGQMNGDVRPASFEQPTPRVEPTGIE